MSDKVTFDVKARVGPDGNLYSFIGPNGAGEAELGRTDGFDADGYVENELFKRTDWTDELAAILAPEGRAVRVGEVTGAPGGIDSLAFEKPDELAE